MHVSKRQAALAALVFVAEFAAEVGDEARAELLGLTRREQSSLERVRREIRVLTRDLKRRAHDTLAGAYFQLMPTALEAIREDFDMASAPRGY